MVIIIILLLLSVTHTTVSHQANVIIRLQSISGNTVLVNIYIIRISVQCVIIIYHYAQL